MMISFKLSHRWAAAITLTLLTAASAQGEVMWNSDVFSANAEGRVVSIQSNKGGASPIFRSGDWTDPVLLGNYPNWDHWNLDTSAGRDSEGYLNFAVRLWEYANQNWNYDRYVLNSAGELVDTILNSPGLGKAAAFTDGADVNFHTRPVATTQYFAAVDSDEYVHLFWTVSAGGWEIQYSKLDPDGNTVIPWKLITQGADPWNFYVQPVVLSDDTVVVTWMRDTEDICAIKTYDSGVTWSDIIVLLDRTDAPQASCIKTAVGDDDSLHFVWRTLDWNTYEEKIWYAKMRADDSIAVTESVFYEGANWYPYLSIDNTGRLHVTFTPKYDVSMTIYYTCLRSDLDLDGHDATDEMLTLIPEQLVVSDNVPLHYPANVPDPSGGVHVIYDRGVYGCETNKAVYYTMLPPACPGDVDGSGEVDIDDLFAVLAAWGQTGVPEDVNSDGVVDIDDVFFVLANWGPCS